MKYLVDRIKTERQPVYEHTRVVDAATGKPVEPETYESHVTGYADVPYCYLTWTLSNGAELKDAFAFEPGADEATLAALIETRWLEVIEPGFDVQPDATELADLQALVGRPVEVDSRVLRAAAAAKGGK